jgi:hypothetical protein
MPRFSPYLIALIACAAIPLHAAEWFVATTGSNTLGMTLTVS